MTAMALDEVGWTGQGKGGVEHLSEKILLLSSCCVELTQQPVEYRLRHDGEMIVFIYFLPV